LSVGCVETISALSFVKYYTDRQTDRQTEQTDRQTDRTDRQTEQTHRQTDRADSWTDRADKQTNCIKELNVKEITNIFTNLFIK